MLDSRAYSSGWGTAQRHTAKETLPREDESLGYVWEGPNPSCWAGSPGVVTGLSQEVNDERQRQRKRRLLAFCLQLMLFFVTSENWFSVLEGQFPRLTSGEGAGLPLLTEGFEEVCQGICQTA